MPEFKYYSCQKIVSAKHQYKISCSEECHRILYMNCSGLDKVERKLLYQQKCDIIKQELSTYNNEIDFHSVYYKIIEADKNI